MALAKITHEQGHMFWRCRNCDRILGEFIGDRIVIKIGSVLISLPRRAEPDQTCPRCGAVSDTSDRTARIA